MTFTSHGMRNNFWPKHVYETWRTGNSVYVSLQISIIPHQLSGTVSSCVYLIQQTKVLLFFSHEASIWDLSSEPNASFPAISPTRLAYFCHHQKNNNSNSVNPVWNRNKLGNDHFQVTIAKRPFFSTLHNVTVVN